MSGAGPMLIVHHLETSRSQRILWLLEELGAPYELKVYRRDKVTRLAPPELKAIHPLGKSPVVTDDGAVIAESAVIIEYIVGKYGHLGTGELAHLAPAAGTPAHAPWATREAARAEGRKAATDGMAALKAANPALYSSTNVAKCCAVVWYGSPLRIIIMLQFSKRSLPATPSQ